MAYNKTQLNPDKTFERHVYHRDQFAHYLRWTHVLKYCFRNTGKKVLDWGCGSGSMAEVLYRNRAKMNSYLGVDIRNRTIDKANEKYAKVDWVEFKTADLCGDVDFGNDWDIITSFEVIEHIGKQNADVFCENIIRHCKDDTVVFLSTPNYDARVGAAGNHTYDSGDGRGVAVQEFGHHELREVLERHFVVRQKYGTFASIRDYKNKLNDWQQHMFKDLSKYYDTNLLSVIMAPLFPEESRNCLWILEKKPAAVTSPRLEV